MDKQQNTAAERPSNISFEFAERLIRLPKMVVEKEEPLNSVGFKLAGGKARYNLYSQDEPDISFLLEIKSSKKKRLKISLHFQENDSHIGLLRVDYKGLHKNPEHAAEYLPDKFKSYVGEWFDYDVPHIHYNVEGYKTLAWAIPLADDDFSPKDLANYGDAIKAILSFAETINLRTKFEDMQHELA